MAGSLGEWIIKHNDFNLWIAIGMGKVEGLVTEGIFSVSVDGIT